MYTLKPSTLVNIAVALLLYVPATMASRSPTPGLFNARRWGLVERYPVLTEYNAGLNRLLVVPYHLFRRIFPSVSSDIEDRRQNENFGRRYSKTLTLWIAFISIQDQLSEAFAVDAIFTLLAQFMPIEFAHTIFVMIASWTSLIIGDMLYIYLENRRLNVESIHKRPLRERIEQNFENYIQYSGLAGVVATTGVKDFASDVWSDTATFGLRIAEGFVRGMLLLTSSVLLIRLALRARGEYERDEATPVLLGITALTAIRNGIGFAAVCQGRDQSDIVIEKDFLLLLIHLTIVSPILRIFWLRLV